MQPGCSSLVRTKNHSPTGREGSPSAQHILGEEELEGVGVSPPNNSSFNFQSCKKVALDHREGLYL